MRKAEVRALAAAEGLRPADKRSSAGICFIGRRRSFGSFLEQYVPPLPGRYVDAGSGTDLGPCANLLALTPGQRAPLGGGGARRYIAGKDLAARLAFVASGHDHPALRARRALLMPARWVGGGAPPGLLGGGGSAAVDSDGWRQPGLPCSCQARYRQADAACIVQAAGGDGWRPGDGSGGTRFEQSRFAGGSIESAVAAVAASAAAPATASSGGAGGGSFGVGDGPFLRLSLAEPLRGLAPGQAVVMYDGPVVLGSALLAAPGPTLAEEAGGG